MSSLDRLAGCRCGACGGKVGRVNLVSLRRRATWEFPRSGNVLTGEDGEAVAVVCDRCIDAKREVREAVEFRGDEVIYHRVGDLEELPPAKTYVLVHVAPHVKPRAIRCLFCGSESWNRNDVENRYCGRCGRCRRFHDK